MPGAIIPNDWDGSTFECNRVIWPASNQWQAILLGQATEPTFSSYWDPETGDEEAAIQAVNDAYALTVPEIYAEECDLPNVPVVAFKVQINVPFVVPPSVFTKIPWADYFADHNNPGFDFLTSGHRPGPVGKVGVWHYDVQIFFGPSLPTIYSARAVITETGQQIAKADNDRSNIVLGFDWVWTATSKQVEIQVFSGVSSTVRTPIGDTFFSGHYVGPVTE